MTTHVVVQLTITDLEAFGEYRAVAGGAVAKHGGTVIAAGPGEVLADGGGTSLCVIITFPSDDDARGWINDPELADIHAMRDRGAKSTIVIVPTV
jgi:uncharacterized protein (DUF1330 family)